MYGKVSKPYWDDAPVAVVAGGPSLKGLDLKRLSTGNNYTLAVKGSIFDMPWSDAGFGLDGPRYLEWRSRLATEVSSRVYWALPYEQLANAGPPPAKHITYLRRLDGQQVSEDPRVIYGGGTSGFGAMQICLLKRARKIILFGFDYGGDVTGATDFRHNDKHYIGKRTQSAVNWDAWARHFAVYVPYVNDRSIRVLNACPESAITCFPKVTLEDGIALLTE